jgi:putative membrane protein
MTQTKDLVMTRKWITLITLAAALLGGGIAATAADKASEKFIKEAIEGNLAEVAVGKLAQEKGQSDGVRAFGAQLVNDHGGRQSKGDVDGRDPLFNDARTVPIE